MNDIKAIKAILKLYKLLPEKLRVLLKDFKNKATGQVNQRSDSKVSINFSYVLKKGQKSTLDESSGCYIKFYESPADFLLYRFLIFSIRSERINNNIDVGIRLVLEQTIYPSFNEMLIRELKSLNKIGIDISNHWKYVTFDLAEFAPLQYKIKPLPTNTNPNQINKIAFFVDNGIINRCPHGTIYIKDIFFEK